jgi:hypothetical protein
MKKIIFLSFSLLFTNFILAQQDINVNAPSSVEVGLNSNFGFIFRPITKIPVSSDTQNPVTYYRITSWLISAPSANFNNSGTNYYNDNSQSLTNVALGSPSNLNFPIRWDDNSNLLTDGIHIIVNVTYYLKNGGQPNNANQYYSLDYTVNINRIFTPTINSPVILSCCTTPVTFSASGYGTANVFNWSIGGGTYTGSGSSITVTPNSANGAVSATCVVSRSSGSSSYTRIYSTTINRTARTASFTPSYSTNPPYNYICKGSIGLQMNMPTQCGISSINWVAQNCTISGQNTLTPTITPTSAIATGASINVYAEVSFIGGCIATTPSISFKILDSTTAPTPQGYFTVTASSGSICTAEIFDLSFVSTDGFNNGITTVSPVFLWGPGDELHYRNGRPTTVTVRNINLCTGLSSSKTFSVYPSAPCISTAKLASKAKIVTSIKVESTEILATSLVITPNPTKGNITAMLLDNYSGNYQIFDINGVLVQQAKFDNQTELQIEMSQNLKSGVYVLKVITDTNIFTGKIILNK